VHPRAQRVVPEDGWVREVARDAAGLKALEALTLPGKLVQQ